MAEGGLPTEPSGLSAAQATPPCTSQVRNVWAVDEASAQTAGTLGLDGQDREEGDVGTGPGVCGGCSCLST